MLSGERAKAKAQLDNTGSLKTMGRENVFLAIERIGESLTEAWYAAEQWTGDFTGRPARSGDELPAKAVRLGLDQ